MARIVDNEHLKASRAAAEICFMLAQANMNLEYLDEENSGIFAQSYASIYHDLSVTLKHCCILNSTIMEVYHKDKPKP